MIIKLLSVVQSAIEVIHKRLQPKPRRPTMTTSDPSQPTPPATDPTTPPDTTPTGTDPSATPPATTAPSTDTPPLAPPAVDQATIDNLNALVSQVEADLGTYSNAAAKASASAAQAATDASAATAAQEKVHTDIVNLSLVVSKLDPGTPGLLRAQNAFRRYGGLRPSTLQGTINTK